MAEQFQIYRCEVCGSVVEILNATQCVPSCCGKPMKLLKENTSDGAKEKHVPVIEATPNGCKVKVGSVAHPMAEDHYIPFIEILTKDGHHCKKILKPGDAPEAEYGVKPADIVYAREWCNKHGMWRS